MVKAIYWIVIIAAGVFIGIAAFDRFKASQPTADSQAADRQEAIQPSGGRLPGTGGQEGQHDKKRGLKTICTVDQETEDCTCIDRESGEIIPKPRYDCFLRASRSSG